MNETTPISDRALVDIKKYFKFLFDRGNVIYSAKTINEYWMVWDVLLKNRDYYIRFESEKGVYDISFDSPSKGFMRMHALIFFLSDETKFIELGDGCLGIFRNDMKTKADLLQEYIDEFEPSFERKFPETEEKVKLAEQRYYEKFTGT